jgi:hypothetical protein
MERVTPLRIAKLILIHGRYAGENTQKAKAVASTVVLRASMIGPDAEENRLFYRSAHPASGQEILKMAKKSRSDFRQY